MTIAPGPAQAKARQANARGSKLFCGCQGAAALALLLGGQLCLHLTAQGQKPAGEPRSDLPQSAMMAVADFLPKGHVTDGSLSYQKEIQQAIDAAARAGRTLVFGPMVYGLDESGLQLRSGSRLWLYGAVFRFGPDCRQDGQAFAGHDISDVQLLGGTIVGHNHTWAEGVNIRGLYITGRSHNLRFRDLHLRDLSSNGLGVFGTAANPVRDIWVTDLVIENCCNRYGDYLSERVGPEKGSKREDQGLIAFYHVQEFVVRGCRLEKSRSDGTHFYRCRQGQFVHNKVYAAQMGGYFVETCSDILASDNIIRDNGSRGATIERGSKNCTLVGNVVAGSGREGLWAPDCSGLVITGNIFDRNGRKPNGPKAHQIWNANITINEDPFDPTRSPTEDYVLAHNILYTTASQGAAIRIDANRQTAGILIKDNLLRGDNRHIHLDGEGQKKVTIQGNQ